MTAKEYLRRAYKLNEEIDQLEAAKHKMFNRITSITPKYNSDIRVNEILIPTISFPFRKK